MNILKVHVIPDVNNSIDVNVVIIIIIIIIIVIIIIVITIIFISIIITMSSIKTIYQFLRCPDSSSKRRSRRIME